MSLFMEFFQGDDTVIVRYFTNQEQGEIKFCVIYIDGMVDVETANRNILQPIIQNTFPKDFEGNMDVILEQVVLSNHAEKITNVDELVMRICAAKAYY